MNEKELKEAEALYIALGGNLSDLPEPAGEFQLGSTTVEVNEYNRQDMEYKTELKCETMRMMNEYERKNMHWFSYRTGSKYYTLEEIETERPVTPEDEAEARDEVDGK